ncbi:MAG: gliding motility-associated C-terminal domain-containing protein [Bacteroidetes bacterium]|nr:gliding motility-associated C-terminal domain-containing protein [Bacteroidota bacterium]
MKLIRALTFFLLTQSLFCVAQKQNNVWAFGIGCGFDFSSGSPVLLQTKMGTSEGCAAVSDSQGHLLFYSDGNRVYDRNNDTMPHGKGLLGNTGGWATNYGSSTQGVTIVPIIDDPYRYYVFTTDCIESLTPAYLGYLRCNLVDMRLNNGLGDVDTTVKNKILVGHIGEKAFAVRGAGCYNWLITHRYGNDEFLAFKIGASGIDTVPVISSSTTLDSIGEYSYDGGEIKVSPDGKTLITEASYGYMELFSFDNTTGRISNARFLDSVLGIGYGLEWSPDATKLYISNFAGRIRQYDFSLMPDINAVRSSVVTVGDSGSYGTMRLGPDGKIYMAKANQNTMYCINKPNLKGAACDVDTLSFNPPPTIDMHYQLGLGNPVPFHNDTLFMVNDTTLCTDTLLQLNGPAGYSGYAWSTGDSTQNITVQKAGEYKLQAFGHCPVQEFDYNINLQDCNCNVSIPTAFSPNADGKNDRFSVITGDLKSFHMEIYNRWGQPVFYTSVIGHSWDGTFNGIQCDADTYYYYVRLRCIKGQEIFRKGDVTLLR